MPNAAAEAVESPKNRPEFRQDSETHPECPKGTHPQSPTLFRCGIKTGFESTFGLPRALLRKDISDWMEKVVAEHYPNLRMSAARMFFDGVLSDGVKPFSKIPTGAQRQLKIILDFLDVLETALYETKKAEYEKAWLDRTRARIAWEQRAERTAIDSFNRQLKKRIAAMAKTKAAELPDAQVESAIEEATEDANKTPGKP